MLFKKKRADEASATLLAYRRLFSTEDGQIVLKDLMNSCFFNRSTIGGDPHETYYNEGVRSVVLRIFETANISSERIEQMRKHMLVAEMEGTDV